VFFFGILITKMQLQAISVVDQRKKIFATAFAKASAAASTTSCRAFPCSISD
jgi:hypothetical protein